MMHTVLRRSPIGLISPRRAPRCLLATQSLSTAQPPTLPVKAYYLANHIDLQKIKYDAYVSTGRKELQSKSVTWTLNAEQNQYISVFKFGGVVMFNVPDEQHQQHIATIKGAATGTIAADEQEHTETYRVLVNKDLERPSVIKQEHVNVRALDLNNVIIIATVMAQSVALDYYAISVQRMLDNFITLNMQIQASGDVGGVCTPKSLFKMVAENNVVMTNVLSKVSTPLPLCMPAWHLLTPPPVQQLGIFEGSDAAWENTDYTHTWDALRKDFEIDFRFKDLAKKLDIIKDDSRFFLEVLHNKKSTKMEWIIIALIAFEATIGIAGLVGLGACHGYCPLPGVN